MTTLDFRTRLNQRCPRDDQGRALCATCRAVLDESEILRCASCSAESERRFDERMRDTKERARVSRIETIARRALEFVPDWPHARVESPEFAAKCRSKRLRLFAAQYAIERGSAALLGPSGIGKTTACVALVHRLIDEEIAAEIASKGAQPPAHVLASGIVWTSARAIVFARRTHELGSDPPLLARCIGASILLIDELGSEPHDRDGDLFGVIDARYAQSRPTVITSGLTAAEFDARYGTALLRRITERGAKIEDHGL